MSEWQTVPAEDFCASVRDGTHDSPKPVVHGRFLVTSRHIVGGRLDLSNAYLISQEDFDAINKRSKVNQWDVLISMIGTVGESCLIKAEPNFAIKNIGLFKSKGELEGKWLYYYLRNPSTQQIIKEQSRGTTQQYIPLGALRGFPITAPVDKNEMRAIVDILGTLDDKIELNRRMNETLEAIARAMFKSWFVDFDPVRAKMSGEPPESICQRHGLTPDLLALFPDRLADSELGEIPEGWEVHGLDSMATLSTKSVAPSTKPTEIFEHYSIPAFDAGATPSYEFGATIKSNKYVVSPIAVLVSKLNPETQRIWLPSVKTENAVCSTEFMQFEPRFNYVRSFLYLLMKAETMQAEILKRVTGSTGSRQRAQPSQIAVLPIAVPTEEMVKAFDLLINPMLSHAMSNVDQSQTLASLRDSLLPSLLSGELRVNDAEILNEGVSA